MATLEFTLKELAEVTNSQLQGDANFRISGVNSLESAASSEASFLANDSYIEAMKLSLAGVICISSDKVQSDDKNYLITDDPSLTFQQIAEIFLNQNTSFSGFEGIHPSSVIHPSASIAKNVTICPNAVIDQNTFIGENTFIGPGVTIGPDTHIGHDCIIHARVTIREQSKIGNFVILQPGVVIGSCGFGYTADSKGQFQKIAQIGNVLIEDYVEIGANTTIDRARFKQTKISKGTKIDNLVQIGHNVEIGENNAIAAQSGIAGSSKTGKHVLMGGQVGIVGHVDIADFSILGTRAGVTKTIKKSGKYLGAPAQPLQSFNKQLIYIKKIASLIEQVKILKEEIEKLKLSN